MAKTDERIQADVLAQIQWNNRVDASDVKVTADEGRVILTGTVLSRAAWHAALASAQAVRGVREVENRLIVRYPSGRAMDDAQVRENAESLLAWDAALDASRIDVSVLSGIATLTGTVDSYWQKNRAEELLTNLTGIVDVSNKLETKPEKALEGTTVADAVRAALRRNVLVDEAEIDVEVDAGNVVLSGTVESVPARRAAMEAALFTEGVANVEDRLRVEPS